jgi:hypothetical protein
MANPEKPAQRSRSRTERRGMGQSGYTAGRREGDTAVDHSVDTRHVREPDPPASAPEPASGKPSPANSAPGVRGNTAIESGGLASDDRFTGRGGRVERDDPDDADDIER